MPTEMDTTATARLSTTLLAEMVVAFISGGTTLNNTTLTAGCTM